MFRHRSIDSLTSVKDLRKSTEVDAQQKRAISELSARYRGYVHCDKDESVSVYLPSPEDIQIAHQQMKSYRKEKHPLFAHGFSYSSRLRVNEGSLELSSSFNDTSQPPIELSIALKKVVLVGYIREYLYVMAQRKEDWQFRCHSFKLGSTGKAKQLAQILDGATACRKPFQMRTHRRRPSLDNSFGNPSPIGSPRSFAPLDRTLSICSLGDDAGYQGSFASGHPSSTDVSPRSSNNQSPYFAGMLSLPGSAAGSTEHLDAAGCRSPLSRSLSSFQSMGDLSASCPSSPFRRSPIPFASRSGSRCTSMASLYSVNSLDNLYTVDDDDDDDDDEATNDELPVCALCDECYEKRDDWKIIRSCPHEFHKACLDRWRNISNMCPTCDVFMKTECHTLTYHGSEPISSEIEDLHDIDVQFVGEMILGDSKAHPYQVKAKVGTKDFLFQGVCPTSSVAPYQRKASFVLIEGETPTLPAPTGAPSKELIADWANAKRLRSRKKHDDVVRLDQVNETTFALTYRNGQPDVDTYTFRTFVFSLPNTKEFEAVYGELKTRFEKRIGWEFPESDYDHSLA